MEAAKLCSPLSQPLPHLPQGLSDSKDTSALPARGISTGMSSWGHLQRHPSQGMEKGQDLDFQDVTSVSPHFASAAHSLTTLPPLPLGLLAIPCP